LQFLRRLFIRASQEAESCSRVEISVNGEHLGGFTLSAAQR
jgi:hypothetical protein